MPGALDWLMRQLGGDPEAEGAATTSSAMQPAVEDWYDRGGVAGMMGLQPWDVQAAQSQQKMQEMIRQGRYGEAALAGMEHPALGFGVGNIGKAGPRFTIRKSYDLPEGGSYAIHSPEGNPVGGAHITISPDGRVADVGNVWAGDPDLPNNIALDPSAANAANTLGPRAMRQIALDFFHGNPSVQEIAGERISGARVTPGDASVRRKQFDTALDRLRQLLGEPPT